LIWGAHVKNPISLLTAKDLAQVACATWLDHGKPCSLPYFRANFRNVAWFANANGHDHAKARMFEAV